MQSVQFVRFPRSLCLHHSKKFESGCDATLKFFNRNLTLIQLDFSCAPRTMLVEIQLNCLMKFSAILSVPPNIDDSLSSSDVIVREGSNITLKCRAHGSPQPTIKWKRDDNSKININKSLSGERVSYRTFNFLCTLIEFRFLSQSSNGTRKCWKSPEYRVWTWERTCASHKTQFRQASASGLKSALIVST